MGISILRVVVLFFATFFSVHVIGQTVSNTSSQIQATGGGAGIVQGALAPPSHPKFLSYPTSHVKPPFINSGDAVNDQIVFDMRLQHWFFLFDQEEYVARYGPMPKNLPGGVTALQYATNPPNHAFSKDLEDYIKGNSGPAQTAPATH